MKGKIKLLSLLMALAMVATLFVACDNPSGGDDTSGGGSGETVELTWWHWGNTPTNGDAAIKALNEKSAKDIGVTINFIWATQDDSKLKTALSTGTQDDLAFVCSWFANYLSTAQSGQLADITELVKAQTELYDFIPDWAWEAVTVNDAIYAVPVMKDSAAEQFWLVNREYVLDGAGAQAEFEATGPRVASVTPLLRKVKAYADAGNPYPNDLTAPFNYNKAGLNGYETGWDMVQGSLHIGDKIDEEGIKIVSAYEDEDMRADYRELATWYKEGLVNADCAQTETEPANIIVSTAQGWEGAEVSSWGQGKNYTVAINKKYGPVATRATVLGGTNAVFANSQHKEEAVKYLAYINTNKEYRDMLAYGAEGTNFEYTTDENGDKFVKKLNNDFEPGTFAQGTTWILTPTEGVPATMYTDIQAMSEGAEATELIGFALDESNLGTQIAACSGILSQYTNGIQCGTYDDPDAVIDQMLTELRGSGYDTVIEEAQKQVDEYLANRG